MVTKLYPPSHYSIYLGRALIQALPKNMKIRFYTNMTEKNMPFNCTEPVWQENPLYPFQLFRRALIEKPDISHVQHETSMFGGWITAAAFPMLLILLRLAGSKIVVTVHATPAVRLINSRFARAFGFPAALSPLLRASMVLLYVSITALSSRIIVHSKYCKDVLVRDYGGKSKSIDVIPIGVGKVHQAPSSRLGYWKDRIGNRRVILFFGYLGERKGVEYLVDAFRFVRDKHDRLLLVIAGGMLPYTHRYLSHLKSLIHGLGLDNNVLLFSITPMPLGDLHALYSLAEIVVLPYTYSISASLALSYAFEHKKPVVVTNTGVFPDEVQQGKNGLLVRPRDAVALATAIDTLISDRRLRHNMSRHIKHATACQSWDESAHKTIEVYCKTLRK